MPTVLVIDDDAAMRAIVRAALPDCQISEAPDGARGLAHLDEGAHAPDLIILDIIMDHLDGYDTCARIRDIAPNIPILPFTGAPEAIPFLAELGCAPAVIKPVAVRELRDAALRAIGAPPSRVQPGAAVFACFQRKAAEREALARHDAALARYGLLATNPALGVGLRMLIEHAGVTLELEAASVAALRCTPSAGTLTALFVAGEDWADARPYAQEHGIPLVVIAARATEGAAIALLSGADPLGIMPADAAAFASTVPDVLAAVVGGRRAVAPVVAAALATTRLSPQERNVAILVGYGLAPAEIAAVIGVAARSVAQYQTRICQKLGVDGVRGLRAWVRAWEAERALQLS